MHEEGLIYPVKRKKECKKEIENFVKVNNVYILTEEQFLKMRNAPNQYREALLDTIGSINTLLNKLTIFKNDLTKLTEDE